MADIVIAALIVVAGYAVSVGVGLVLARRLFPDSRVRGRMQDRMFVTDQALTDEQIKRVREEIARSAPTIVRHAQRAIVDRNHRGCA